MIGLVDELPHVIESYEGRGLKREASNVSKFADKIVFPGESISEAFNGCSPFDPEKAVILPQGLYRRNRFRTKADKSRARASLRSALGLTDDVRVALAVGFGDSRKGIDLFVQIGDHVLSRFTDIVFVWVGEIESGVRQKVMKRVSDSKHAERFVFPGFCEDLDVYFAGADIFLLTSREDPFPTVVLAAAEIGLPIRRERFTATTLAQQRARRNRFPDIEAARASYRSGQFVWATSAEVSGGGAMNSSFYGEALIPGQHVSRAYADHFDVVNERFDGGRYDQRLFVLRRNSYNPPVRSQPTK